MFLCVAISDEAFERIKDGDYKADPGISEASAACLFTRKLLGILFRAIWADEKEKIFQFLFFEIQTQHDSLKCISWKWLFMISLWSTSVWIKPHTIVFSIHVTIFHCQCCTIGWKEMHWCSIPFWFNEPFTCEVKIRILSFVESGELCTKVCLRGADTLHSLHATAVCVTPHWQEQAYIVVCT